MTIPGKYVITDITQWKDRLKMPDLTKYDWEKLAAEETAPWDQENKVSFIMNNNQKLIKEKYRAAALRQRSLSGRVMNLLYPFPYR